MIDTTKINEQIKELIKIADDLKNNKLHDILLSAADTIRYLLAKLQEAGHPKWTRCDKQLPKKSGYYLCTIFCDDGSTLVKTIYFNHLQLWIEDCEDVIEPYAWMPVPEACPAP